MERDKFVITINNYLTCYAISKLAEHLGVEKHMIGSWSRGEQLPVEVARDEILNHLFELSYEDCGPF